MRRQSHAFYQRWLIASVLLACAAPSIAQPPSHTPKIGYVPDSKTATAIAEAVLVNVCGQEAISAERPLHAKSQDNLWTIKTSLTSSGRGCVSTVELQRSDGRIVSVTNQPKENLVPDSKTALAIAEAVLVHIYGKKTINAEKPLSVSLKDNVWTVGGSLPEGWDGGVAVLQLRSEDGRILSVTHGK